MAARNIIFTATNDLSYDQRMQRIATSLVQAGYAVTLVGRQRPQSIPLAPQAYRQVRLPCWWQRGKAFYLEYQLRLFFFLLRQPADLFSGVDLDTALAVAAAAWLRGKPLVIDLHEYFTEVPEVVDRPFTRWVWEKVAQLVIPRASWVYTVGPALAEIFGQRYGRPVAVLRNVPWRRPSVPAPGQPPIILYQGMLNEGRGLEAMIAAMPHLPTCQLWLVGDGDIAAQLRAQAAASSAAARITFWGYQSPAVLHALTPQATLGINLLENRGLSYYYSLANKAFDYVQAGIPSVQMDFPEYRALNARYPVFLLVPNLDPLALAATIGKLLAAPNTYAAMATACQRAAADWCWEQEQELLVSGYQALLPPSVD